MGLFDFVGKALGISADAASGGLFSLGASLLNGISNSNSQKAANEANLKIAQMNNDTQLQMMRENNEFNKQQAIDMFNMQNEYNDPAAQMQRLRAAGINPAAAFGDGGVSASSGVASGSPASSVGVPSLTSPVMQPVPSVTAGLLEGLLSLSKVKSNNSSSSLNDANASRINTLVDAELSNLLADKKYKDVQTSYLEFQSNMDRLYQGLERGTRISKITAEIKNLGAEFTNLLLQGDYVKARTAFEKANTLLTNSRNAQVKQETPILIENLKRTGQLILAQANAQNASALASRASANLTNEQAENIRLLRDDTVRLTRAIAKEKESNARVASSTVMQQIEHWKNKVVFDEKQKAQMDEAIRRAKKDNDWYEVDKCVDILDTVVKDGVSIMSRGLFSGGDKQRVGQRTEQYRYDDDGNLIGSTETINQYLYE